MAPPVLQAAASSSKAAKLSGLKSSRFASASNSHEATPTAVKPGASRDAKVSNGDTDVSLRISA